MFVAQTLDGERLPVLLCMRCYEQVFSKDHWAKLLRGRHKDLKENDDFYFDGEFCYSILNLDADDNTVPARRGPVVRLRISPEELLHPEEDQCGFCQIIVGLDKEQKLSSDPSPKVELDLQLYFPRRYSGLRLSMLLRVALTLTFIEPQPEQKWTNNTFLALIVEAGVKDDDVDDREVSLAQRIEVPQPLPLHSLVELDHWMRECEGHANCNSPHPSKLPTRVIDVSQTEENDKSVKLVEFEDKPMGKYIALSYVWGTSNVLRLLQTTRTSFRVGIAYDTLPKTVKDAVAVTRVLGVRYLWVDALCILQDSTADKALEIPNMHHYYRNAHAVISASGADDVNSGLFRPEHTDADVLTSVRSQATTSIGDFGPVPPRIILYEPEPDPDPVMLLIDQNPPLCSYDGEPINRRAWTLQESALARRLISFPASGGLIMRCSEGERCAGQLLGDPTQEDPTSGYMEDFASTDQPPSRIDILDKWNTTVVNYSQRAMSNQSDILVAIAALAQDFHLRFGSMLGDYVAGLWTKTLLEGLLWHTASARHPDRSSFLQPTHADGNRHAPSWSWASCRQGLVFRARQETNLLFERPQEELPKPCWLVDVIKSTVNLQDGNFPFGAVQSGVLELKGRLVPIKRSIPKPRPGKEEDKCPIEDVGLCLDSEYDFADQSTIFAPDSMRSMELIDATCFWVPIYDATRGRCRGIIVRRDRADSFSDFHRLGFAEFQPPDGDVEAFPLQTIRLI